MKVITKLNITKKGKTIPKTISSEMITSTIDYKVESCLIPYINCLRLLQLSKNIKRCIKFALLYTSRILLDN